MLGWDCRSCICSCAPPGSRRERRRERWSRRACVWSGGTPRQQVGMACDPWGGSLVGFLAAGLSAAAHAISPSQSTCASWNPVPAPNHPASAASERSEAALVAQLRSLASQLESAQEQVATERAEACSARRDAEAAAAHAQSREAVLASQVEEWRMRAQAGSMAQSELAAERKVALDSRLAVAVMQRERDAMRAALQEREAEAARQAARVAGLQGELGGARAALADLRLDLAEERRRALALADALARGACGDASPGGRPGTPGQRALREAMSAARAELAEKEAQLAACMEDLMLERRRCAELHAQTLDQAMEIDDLHAEVAGLLDAGAAREADTLGGAGPGCDTPAVQQEVVELRDALEASRRVTQDLQRQKAGLEEEVLALTSRALESQPRPPTDAESWLMVS
uniref:Uncharacterized protein n=1 Tax=Auxenochlorella protothecoides TaxID=3075 RepID=A0A1D1ZY12_AUXPR